MLDANIPVSRRSLLRSSACGFGSLAFSGLLSQASGNTPSVSLRNPLAPQEPMFTPRAKRIIFIFMQGGPSHVDTFDYKPLLAKKDGEQLEFKDSRTIAKTGTFGKEKVMQSLWKFRQYGESGHWVSDLFPEIGRQVDDLCFVHSMHTTGVAHGPSTLFLHTGTTNLIMPSIGSWITYGLGTENENIPGFITISPSASNGGPRNFSNAFLPSHFQGTALGRAGQPADKARFNNIKNEQWSISKQRQQLKLLQSLNQSQLQSHKADDELAAVINSFELAFRMQQHAPGLTDLSGESKSTFDLYGIGQEETDDFGRQCLLARRMAEAGTRYIQVNYADNGNTPRWDQHSKIQQHAIHAKATDKPIAGLIQDMKQRGLLEDTLIWWGGEFGRNPFKQGVDGRDHNPKGFTHFLCGAGVKAGFSYGATDEFGHEAVENKVHMHDMHATLLHLLGIDHERLTYRHAGRDFRLTDVEGHVVTDLFA
ncbi:DUF1501 domain-containing protein [uncultured Gimesia sp.]|jgi:hypothetical protein|uniref:DUF1501 domain-containing protein n=1 Tax=uncultured Gimesia sp. TaxID=1678688 RepID=UPI002609EB24|nr:DUF1501 domain-containing protein [uncultured Gimesia sp.]